MDGYLSEHVCDLHVVIVFEPFFLIISLSQKCICPYKERDPVLKYCIRKWKTFHAKIFHFLPGRVKDNFKVVGIREG